MSTIKSTAGWEHPLLLSAPVSSLSFSLYHCLFFCLWAITVNYQTPAWSPVTCVAPVASAPYRKTAVKDYDGWVHESHECSTMCPVIRLIKSPFLVQYMRSMCMWHAYNWLLKGWVIQMAHKTEWNLTFDPGKRILIKQHWTRGPVTSLPRGSTASDGLSRWFTVGCSWMLLKNLVCRTRLSIDAMEHAAIKLLMGQNLDNVQCLLAVY